MTVNDRQEPGDDAKDVCCCGDYRHQHVDGKGRCKLGRLCTPYPCGKFRLFQRAARDGPLPAKFSPGDALALRGASTETEGH